MEARATIGHNNPPPDDDEVLPPKGERVVDYERARQVEIAARQIKALFAVPLNRIMEKRKGGEDGRALRRFLIFYARGLGSPVWECALIFGLNRKQIGQEEASYLDMLARNGELEEDVENMTGMCDSAIRVQRGRFIRVSLSEIQADAAAKKAVKEAKAAADRLEAGAPKKKAAKRAQSEAERVQAEANAKHLAEARAQAARIFNRTIEVGSAPNATKAQKQDADKAKKALAELEKLNRKRAP